MKQFQINEKTIEFDETNEYLDFFLEGGKQKLAKIDFGKMLESVQSGQIPIDDKLKEYMQYLQRWTKEAPRKRFYRKMRAEGFTVLSTEQFFDGESGEETIDKLENTGKFADYFLSQIYG